jgi:glycosyltransferase involved in cell wall biosynthesis
MKRAKPRLALLSPYPPQETGVARFTELTIRAAVEHFDVDLFTDAPRPLDMPPDGARDAGAISTQPFLGGNYESIVSVLGNSPFHTPIFDIVEACGGPCILHDCRLTAIYFRRLGEAGFRELAGKILSRPVSRWELELWLNDRELPSMFIEPILERATPLIVHSRTFQELLRDYHGFAAELAPFPALMVFVDEELRDHNRRRTREGLGIADSTFVISTFGFVGTNKGAAACIGALAALRAWGLPAELFFVGEAGAMAEPLIQVARDHGVCDAVHMSARFVSTERYRDFLIASDAGIQLRTYSFGQTSGALADCISAGLPTVASESLAGSCDAPAYVETVPYGASEAWIAERLAEIWESRADRVTLSAERLDYQARNSFARYARRLTEILGLA